MCGAVRAGAFGDADATGYLLAPDPPRPGCPTRRRGSPYRLPGHLTALVSIAQLRDSECGPRTSHRRRNLTSASRRGDSMCVLPYTHSPASGGRYDTVTVNYCCIHDTAKCRFLIHTFHPRRRRHDRLVASPPPRVSERLSQLRLGPWGASSCGWPSAFRRCRHHPRPTAVRAPSRWSPIRDRR